jgi:hypothetical protein
MCWESLINQIYVKNIMKVWWASTVYDNTLNTELQYGWHLRSSWMENTDIHVCTVNASLAHLLLCVYFDNMIISSVMWCDKL